MNLGRILEMLRKAQTVLDVALKMSISQRNFLIGDGSIKITFLLHLCQEVKLIFLNEIIWVQLIPYKGFFGIHISKMGVIINLRILMKNYAVVSEREFMPTTWE